MTFLLHRFVILETCLGIAGGVAGVTSGYWLKARGFLEPIFFSAVLDFLSLLLVFLLPDSREIRKRNEETQKAEKKRIGSALDSDGRNQIESDSEDSSLDCQPSSCSSSCDRGSCSAGT